MKKLFLTLFILLAFVGTAGAWDLNWTASTGAGGYMLYHKTLAATEYTETDVGNILTYDLDAMSLVQGTRYEFFLRAYVSGSYSGDSDHLRWTYPVDPIIIDLPAAPLTITITQ
ncbi:MAG: hypothetical protein KAS32_14040 [Candidatus Peribacteraceae bacterium]|nr:hypothetical protein [Candidatus Peribacteraceae bacterium]